MGDVTDKNGSEYPDHLNPFDENYNGITDLDESNRKQKYNTWGANRGNQVLVKKEKTSFLEKPWAALNISPRNKVVRKLSFLKTAVERISIRKKRDHSASFSEKNSARSHSLHDDFSFRIVSPKQKEKLRHQAFPSLARQEQPSADTAEASNSNHVNGRLTPTEHLADEAQSSTPIKDTVDTLSTPEVTPSQSCGLGARSASMRRSRKKKRPPPPPPPVPPPRSVKPADVVTLNTSREAGADDAHSACSSITQDLERSLPSGDESSLAEFEFDRAKLDHAEYDITDIK